MKTTYLIATAVISLALAAPLAAHHNSPADPEIGDMMGRHEAAIDALGETGAMDPSNGAPTDSSDGSMPEDAGGDPSGTGGPEDPAGTDNGGNRDGTPWPPE